MEENPTLTKEELVANDLALLHLTEFIQSKDAILMTGAGCSGSLYPAWNDFVDLLETSAIEVNPEFKAPKEDFLTFADNVKGCLGSNLYYSLIHSTFKPKELTHLPFHEALCRLPFKAFTTTNYDIVLEHATTAVTKKFCDFLHFEGSAKNEILEFLQSLNFNKQSKKPIVHLHGIYKIPESIVLSGKEYTSKYGFELGENNKSLFEDLKEGNLSLERTSQLLLKHGYEWPLRRKLMWSLLATRRIVFIGFSMSDPYFIKMLDFVKDDLSTHDAETHFLILRVTPSTIRRSKEHAVHLKREYGIITVFFEDENDKYEGLSKFISELENKVNSKSNKIESVHDIAKAVKVPLPKGDIKLTDKLFSLSKTQ